MTIYQKREIKDAVISLLFFTMQKIKNLVKLFKVLVCLARAKRAFCFIRPAKSAGAYAPCAPLFISFFRFF